MTSANRSSIWTIQLKQGSCDAVALGHHRHARRGNVMPLSFTPTPATGRSDRGRRHSAANTGVGTVRHPRIARATPARHAQATAATVKVVIGDEELQVIVEDNGIGISPDDLLGDGRRT